MYMNDQLINLLLAQKAERDRLLALPTVTREATAPLSAALSRKLIKVIMGPRRAGKSTLALQALKACPNAYVNFEDEDLKHVSGNDLMEALDRVYGPVPYCLFDEIQEFPNWETLVNKLQRRGRNLVLTGSNSRLLSSELASSLTGRHEAISLLPFGLSEFAAAKGIPEADLALSQACNQWLRSGGFPEVLLEHAGEKYLAALFDAIILRDIVGRHKVRNVLAIKSLGQLLLNNIASRFTARSLERVLKNTSFSTIERYLGYFAECYLFFTLQAFSFKARERVRSERKIFCIDNGLVFSAGFNLLGGESRALENAVFVELVRRGYVPNLSLFYAQTLNRHEIDFLLPHYPNGATLIQVAYAISTQTTLERELKSLAAAAREFRADKLLIITMNEEARHSLGNRRIEIIPMWKWCMTEW